jgi:hypothetical protein
MKVSHEVPLSLLEKSRNFNDYDYCLVHFLPQYERYKLFYEESVKLGRHVLLDNSIFELGSSYNSEEFASWIKKLKPTEYIIPDVLDNGFETIKNLHLWLDRYGDLPGKKIGVVQGQSYEDAKDCYLEIVDKVDKVAFSFDSIFYEDFFYDDGILSKYERWMFGRIFTLNKLAQDNIIDWKKPHHLLGCSLPQEFLYYRGLEFIETIDTSNPIVHGLRGIKYEPWGLLDKVGSMAEFVEIEDFDLELIEYNIGVFRSFIT